MGKWPSHDPIPNFLNPFTSKVGQHCPVWPTQWLVAPLPFADWSQLVYTFINFPCTDDDVMHWWWCHALKLVTYSKIPSCTKKDPRYFFWPFTTEFSFYLKGWNNNSGQERRELIHVFLSPFIVSVTFGRKPNSWAGAIVEADDEESIKHRLFFSYIKHQLNCLPFQQT